MIDTALTLAGTVALVLFCATFALTGLVMAVHDLVPVPVERRRLAERAAQAVREAVAARLALHARAAQTRAARAPARRAARPHPGRVLTGPSTQRPLGARVASPR